MKAFLETFRPVSGYEGLYEVSDFGTVRSLNYNRTGKKKEMKGVNGRDGYERVGLYRDGVLQTFTVHRLVWKAFNGPIPDGMEIDHINTIRDDNRLVNLRVGTRKENVNNPITRTRHLEANKRIHQDPKWQEAIRKAGKRRSEDPKWQEAHRKVMKRISQDPKWREAIRKANKRKSQDQKWRDANRNAVRKAIAKPIVQLDNETGEVLREWECASDAARELGIHNPSISACCRGKRNSAGGYRWKYANNNK